jgi:hypothetical protein
LKLGFEKRYELAEFKEAKRKEVRPRPREVRYRIFRRNVKWEPARECDGLQRSELCISSAHMVKLYSKLCINSRIEHGIDRESLRNIPKHLLSNVTRIGASLTLLDSSTENSFLEGDIKNC